jgi:RNase H-fold protein (predicted Holliday junction resolvase)
VETWNHTDGYLYSNPSRDFSEKRKKGILMLSIDYGSMIIGFIGTVLTGLMAYFGIVRKANADEVSIALSAWKELIEPLKEELRQTKEEVVKLRKTLETTEASHAKETLRLTERIRELEQVNKNRP